MSNINQDKSKLDPMLSLVLMAFNAMSHCSLDSWEVGEKSDCITIKIETLGYVTISVDHKMETNQWGIFCSRTKTGLEGKVGYSADNEQIFEFVKSIEKSGGLITQFRDPFELI